MDRDQFSFVDMYYLYDQIYGLLLHIGNTVKPLVQVAPNPKI